jgi:hypothetical protein
VIGSSLVLKAAKPNDGKLHAALVFGCFGAWGSSTRRI